MLIAASMKTNQQLQNDLRYELKTNEMTIMPACNQKPSLIDTLANIIGLEPQRLHDRICNQIQSSITQNSLPRKLAFVENDVSIFQDYKKYPELVTLAKITLEMVSQIYQAKITVYSLSQQGFLTGLIVNEKGYQQQIKICRINNQYFQVRDSNVYHCGVLSASSSSAPSFSCHQIKANPYNASNPNILANRPNASKGSMKNITVSGNNLSISMNINLNKNNKDDLIQTSSSKLNILASPLLRKSASLLGEYEPTSALNRKNNNKKGGFKHEKSDIEMYENSEEDKISKSESQKNNKDVDDILKPNINHKDEEIDQNMGQDDEHNQQETTHNRQQEQLSELLATFQPPEQPTNVQNQNHQYQNNDTTVNNMPVNSSDGNGNIFHSMTQSNEQEQQQQHPQNMLVGETTNIQQNNNEYYSNEYQQYYQQNLGIYGDYNAYYHNYYYQQQHQNPYLFRNNSTKQAYGNMYHQSPPKMSNSRRQNSIGPSTSNMSTLEIKENERYTGKLKFFDESKNYGFIIMDADNRDIFVHCDDLQKAGISKQRVKCYKQSEGSIQFSFKVMEYFGKYDKSRKAVDLIIIEDDLLPGLYSSHSATA